MTGKVAAGQSDIEAPELKGKPDVRLKPAHRLLLGRNLVSLKFAVLSCIVVAATVIGYSSYSVVRGYEYRQFEQQYGDLMDYLIPSVTTGIEDHPLTVLNIHFTTDLISLSEFVSTITAAKTAAILLGDLHQNSTSWPNVAYSNFPVLADNLM
jgi:hypothetical protein